MAGIVDINKEKRRRKQARRSDKTALVLTGGGVVGAVYQIGALRALDLLGVNYTVNDFDLYVGTSGGAFVASLIASGCRPEDLMLLLDGQTIEGYEPLNLDSLTQPNYRGFLRKGLKLPREALGIVKDILLNAGHMSLADVAAMVADLAPGGFYSLDGLIAMLERQLRRDGRSDDFRRIERELYIVATDLDTCEPVVFGEPGWDDVPVSRAVAASSALPIVYKGVDVRGREFVDGGLRAFANIETAINHGAKMLLIINSIVPFDNERLQPFAGERPQRISQTGLFNVANQMFRCLVWNSFQQKLESWRSEHPDVDFILIEPRRDDHLMFDTQIMNVSQRVQIARHGFESVTVQLASRFEEHREACERHGIEISRRGVIEALQASAPEAPSGTSRWRRILERTGSA